MPNGSNGFIPNTKSLKVLYDSTYQTINNREAYINGAILSNLNVGQVKYVNSSQQAVEVGNGVGGRLKTSLTGNDYRFIIKY